MLSLYIGNCISFCVTMLLQDVLKRPWRLTTKQDVVTTPGKRRRIYNVLKTSNLRSLEDVWFPEDIWFTSSWKCWICDVLKTSDLRHLHDVWFMTSCRRPIYIFLQTSNLQCLEDVWFTTSWRRLIYDVLKMSLKRCLYSNVIVTSIQRRRKWLFCTVWNIQKILSVPV